MKLNLSDFIHRLFFLLITIVWTFMFFWLLETLHEMTDKGFVFFTGLAGFIALSKYDIKKFEGKWF